MTTTVLLVDDHAVVRAGYRMLLGSTGRFSIVGEAENATEAVRLYTQLRPTVVVMDLSLPGMSGVEGIRRIRQRDANARILVFTMHASVAHLELALDAGALGYLTKECDPAILEKALLRVAGGGTFLDRTLAEELAVLRSRGPISPLSALSSREFEVFRLMADGGTISSMATQLSVSQKTISNYMSQVKQKLGTNTSAELTRLAIRLGVVSV
ncbi:MAG: response regulator transcription factor [Pseudomonadota bacterium]